MVPIVPIAGGVPPIAAPAAAPTVAPVPSGNTFQNVFSNAILKVESFHQEAAASTQRFLSGEGEELHSTIMAAQRAELSFDLLLQVRNKVVSAYQEIMKMQM